MTGSKVSIVNLLGNKTNSGRQNRRHDRRFNGSLGKEGVVIPDLTRGSLNEDRSPQACRRQFEENAVQTASAGKTALFRLSGGRNDSPKSLDSPILWGKNGRCRQNLRKT